MQSPYSRVRFPPRPPRRDRTVRGGRSAARTGRQEYWMFVLVNTVIAVVLGLIDRVLFGENLPVLSGLYAVVVLVPALAVAIRRLHDTGRSGWWLLIALIPLIGPIVLFVFYVLDSNRDPNQYGPSPKYSARAAA
ncbi:MAG TPA: DUF805 domain-containing protein [Euzebyales bacterium]